MKLLVISCISLSLIFAIGCATKVGTKSYIEGDSYNTEGWLDENTYQIVAEGTWSRNKDIISQVQRRTMAKEAALLMAQKSIIEKFTGLVISGSSSVVDGVSVETEVEKEFSGFIRGGTIVKVTYNDDDDAAVIYRISSKKLKKRLEKLIRK